VDADASCPSSTARARPLPSSNSGRSLQPVHAFSFVLPAPRSPNPQRGHFYYCAALPAERIRHPNPWTPKNPARIRSRSSRGGRVGSHCDQDVTSRSRTPAGARRTRRAFYSSRVEQHSTENPLAPRKRGMAIARQRSSSVGPLTTTSGSTSRTPVIIRFRAGASLDVCRENARSNRTVVLQRSGHSGPPTPCRGCPSEQSRSCHPAVQQRTQIRRSTEEVAAGTPSVPPKNLCAATPSSRTGRSR